MWLRIDEQTPEDGQDVWYYFGIFDKVYAGKYSRIRDKDYPEGVYSHCFFDETGFLTDDVTYWYPRGGGIVQLEPFRPSLRERAACLYHPETAFNIRWSAEDHGFIATCHEFPGLFAFGVTFDEAAREAKIVLDLFYQSLEEECL